MASGNPSGFGRGGRGAALMQALAKLPRKPGAEERAEESVAAAAAPPTHSMPSLGRGSLLARLKAEASQNKIPQPSQPQLQSQDLGASPPPVPKPMGRGLAAMKALIGSTSHVGRGFKLPSSGDAPMRPTSGSDRQQDRDSSSSPEPPVDEMKAVRLDKSDVPQERQERPRLPTVTRLGESGAPIPLTANYIRLLCRKTMVHQYHVHFNPILDSRRLKISLLAEHKDLLKSIQAFDGNILYLPFELPQKETLLTSTRRTDGSPISIRVVHVKKVPTEQMTHLLNIVFRRIMHILEMVQVGRYNYSPNSAAIVPQRKLEVWPGYITAVREFEGGLMLCMDASHRVLRTETVLESMSFIMSKQPGDAANQISKKLVGTQVLTRYNNKNYRIDDIVWDKNPETTFTLSSGQEISFVEYYKTHYNLDISNLTQPLLLHREKPPKWLPVDAKAEPKFVCLVPELCYMSGLTEDIRKDFALMRDLAVHTRVTPSQRQTAMKKFIDSVNRKPEASAELEFWGLKMDTSTVSIDGRALKSETLQMGQGKKFLAGPQADWGREATRNKLLSAVNINNWGVFFTRRDARKAADFVEMMRREARNMGISVQEPFRCELISDKIEVLLRQLRDAINPQVQIVVIINPTSRDDRYAAIKKLCCVENPVPSQVINANTISKPDKLRSVVQKIALQMNCKLGGELWAVHIPFGKLMVVGIDSFHDPARGKQSIGGVVASVNQSCTRWFSKVCFQKPGQELVHGLQLCLTAALRKYYEENHFLPDKIVIYRDGVGDGQLEVVRDHEAEQLQRCFHTFGQDYRPQAAMVVVQKRINTRIFSKGRNGMVDNPPPGVVVDHTVTRRELYDFFIISQHVRQGTVSPTHYIVLSDGINLAPDKMQQLTYKMTHLYYNWPGTVRVPAPCQYAHKLAYLVGENIHREPSESLSDRLYFL